jgi:predicted transcriptional regulator
MIRLIFEKQMNRFHILFELYKQSDANIDYATDVQILAYNQGVSFKAFTTAWKYLQMEEMIKIRPGGSGYIANITHRGIKAVEEVFQDENERTYYFPAYREMMS